MRVTKQDLRMGDVEREVNCVCFCLDYRDPFIDMGKVDWEGWETVLSHGEDFGSVEAGSKCQLDGYAGKWTSFRNYY